jgi:hypothetical protein
MQEPSFASVNRIDHAGAAWIDHPGPPGGRMSLAVDQVRRPEVGGLHALDDRIAEQFRPDRLADDGPRPIAPNDETKFQPLHGADFEVTESRCRGLVRNRDVFDSRPVENFDIGLAFGVRE